MRNLAQYPLTPEEVVRDLRAQLSVLELEDRLAPGSTVLMSLRSAIDYITSKPLTFEFWLAADQAKGVARD